MQICVEKEYQSTGKVVYNLIKQHIYLEQYDWDIYVIYNMSIDDYDILQDALHRIGARNKDIYDSCKFFSQNKPNIGLTYTNYLTKSSAVIIGRTNSAKSFMNTFIHELSHLQNHIGKYYNLDTDGEEICYLIGDLAERMSKKCSSLFCNCCRR